MMNALLVLLIVPLVARVGISVYAVLRVARK